MTQVDLTQVARFTAAQAELEGVPVLLGRTGYTGEDGFELFFSAEEAPKIWEAILEQGQPEGVQPIGLAARDSLRFEPCMPLYGHEISATINPVQARLNFGISFDKMFIGRDALLKEKLEKTSPVLVGFEMVERGLPRDGYPVHHDGVEIGVVTTGMFSPTTSRYLGMAYIPRELSSADTEIEIIIRDKPVKAKVVKRPFYVPAYRR
jgi:aminomethyltransferase